MWMEGYVEADIQLGITGIHYKILGFGDIVPMNTDFLPATLAYIVVGLIITTMCIGKKLI